MISKPILLAVIGGILIIAAFAFARSNGNNPIESLQRQAREYDCVVSVRNIPLLSPSISKVACRSAGVCYPAFQSGSVLGLLSDQVSIKASTSDWSGSVSGSVSETGLFVTKDFELSPCTNDKELNVVLYADGDRVDDEKVTLV